MSIQIYVLLKSQVMGRTSGGINLWWSSKTVLKTEISWHVSADALLEAYAVETYQRILYQYGNISLSFMASTSTVSPLNTGSIPTLGLLGALLV